MRDVNEPGLIHRDAVSFTPLDVLGNFSPVVRDDFVLKSSVPSTGSFRPRLVGGVQDQWTDAGGSRDSSGRVQKAAAGRFRRRLVCLSHDEPFTEE